MTGNLDQKLLILDGGLGTSLEDLYGVKFTQDTPLWSSHLLLCDPNTLHRIQKDFALTGADIILTPTYQASHHGFRKTKPGITDEEISRHFRSAVSISRSTGKLVALSLGAYGAILQPSQEYSGEYGDIDEEGLVSFHRQRIDAFDLSEVDMIAFETLPRLEEIRAVKRIITGTKSFWISCVFPDDDKLPDGSTIEQVLSAMLVAPRPWAVGMNCTKIHKIDSLVKRFEAAARHLDVKLPRLVLYPDGTNGQVYNTVSQKWIGEDTQDEQWHQKLCHIVQAIQDRGVWEGIVVGGCCKTLPSHIEALQKLLRG